MSGVSHGGILGLQLFLLYIALSAFLNSEHMLHGYADDSTFVAVVPSPGERVAVL